MLCKLKGPILSGGLGVLEPTVPRGQLEMFRSVNTVLAVAVRDRLDDVAEVTSHDNQSSVDKRNGLSGQCLQVWESPLHRSIRSMVLNFKVGHEPLCEGLMQAQNL